MSGHYDYLDGRPAPKPAPIGPVVGPPGTPWESKDIFPTCCVDGCEDAVRDHGLCNTHYMRMQQRGSLEPLPRRTVDDVDVDEVKAARRRLESWSSIARRTGISIHTLQRAVKS